MRQAGVRRLDLRFPQPALFFSFPAFLYLDLGMVLQTFFQWTNTAQQRVQKQIHSQSDEFLTWIVRLVFIRPRL